MGTLVNLVLNGLTLISILMLVALGLAIVYGLMGVINMAHGEFVTVGAYTVAAVQAFSGSYWLGLLLAPIMGALIGLIIEGTMIRYLYTRPTATILATWGLSLVLQQCLQLSFGAAPQRVEGPLQFSMAVLGSSYPAYRLWLIAAAFAIVLACFASLRWTRFGLDVRAVIQNREMAEALGINTKQVYQRAFAAGAAVAAIAGALIAPLTVVIAQMGVNYLARSFFVVIVGGVGSIAGVAAGGGFVGGLETVLNYQVPVTVSQALVLVLAVVVVRFRPAGLVPV
jgi:branched-chain amino acid transport system permease protein/urea transport system permease protein